MKDVIFANPNKYDFVSSLFLGNDELRPVMKKHGVIGDYVYATCGHTCCRFKKDLTEMSEVYVKNEKFPNAEAVFTIDEVEPASEVKFKVNDLIQKFYKFKLQSETYLEECKECDGSGYIECGCCGHEDDCNECDGEGGEEKIKGFGTITVDTDDYNYMSLEGQKLSPSLLYRVIHSALILGEDEVTMKYSNHKCFFIFNDLEILIISRYE